MKNAPIPSVGLTDGLILMLMSQCPLLKFGKLDHLQFTNGLGSRSSFVSCMLYMVLKEMLMNFMIKDPDEHSKVYFTSISLLSNTRGRIAADY